MGAVNIFLGGTGKEVAEDIQDSRDFYGLGISEPIAFDLNARIRDGVHLNLVAPGGDTAAGVASLARDWSTRDPGSGVGPDSDARQPGPQRSPEHSLLVKIGEGVARDPAPSAGLFALRAHGLAVFSMLFDPAMAMAGTGAGNELRNHIADRVQSQTFDGRPPRINLITSTAGGTGAGMVIPLALWLRQQYPNVDLNLVAVTPSAFSRVLRGNMDLEELAAKGFSGTYAMLRELSFFSPAPDPQTTFSPRSLPVTHQGLVYQPGRQERQLFGPRLLVRRSRRRSRRRVRGGRGVSAAPELRRERRRSRSRNGRQPDAVGGRGHRDRVPEAALPATHDLERAAGRRTARCASPPNGSRERVTTPPPSWPTWTIRRPARSADGSTAIVTVLWPSTGAPLQWTQTPPTPWPAASAVMPAPTPRSGRWCRMEPRYRAPTTAPTRRGGART